MSYAGPINETTIHKVRASTTLDTPSTLVERDASGNFAGEAITASTQVLIDHAAASVPNPAAGSHAVVNRNGSLYVKSSAGTEVAVGGAGSTPATTTTTGTIFKQFTGYNKIVGTNGDYASLSAASISAGDSILVISNTVETFGLFINVADVQIDTLPGVKITTSANISVITLSGASRFRSKRLALRCDGNNGSTAIMTMTNTNDCHIADLTMEQNNASNSAAVGLSIASNCSRNYIKANSISTLGGFTSELVNSGLSNEIHMASFMGAFRNTIGSLAGNQTLTLTRSGEVLMMDTSGGALSITLPTAKRGFMFTVIDWAGTFNTQNCTLVRAGSESINGVAANFVMNTQKGFYTWISDGINWFRAG